jgi:hypothetical protein
MTYELLKKFLPFYISKLGDTFRSQLKNLWRHKQDDSS